MKLLIGGDFSGIQPYIYQIISTNAGKSLKGRSYYLKLLSDAIVRYIVKQLSLKKDDIIYNSGGGFCVIADSTPENKEILDRIIAVVERQMFEYHKLDLYVAIDSVEVQNDVFTNNDKQRIGNVWKELYQKRDLKKQCRYNSLITENYDLFFTPQKNSEQGMTDAITGEQIADNDKFEKVEFGYLRKINVQQIKLGEILRTAKSIVISESEDGEALFSINPIGLGIHFNFYNDNKQGNDTIQLKGYDVESYTYEQLCDYKKSGFSRLGVLRMDVDNLGKIFQDCMSSKSKTLADYKRLSKQLHEFFSETIYTEIYRKLDPRHSFIVYSGGDDVFAVGRWNVMIAMAKSIHELYSKTFGCDNLFTISGGVAIVEPKFPIMKAAEMSADEERNAKEHRAEKNSFSIMNTPLSWESEFIAVEGLKSRLVEQITLNRLNNSFIQKIQQLKSMAEIDENHQVKNFKVYWMTSYDLCRLKNRQGENKLIDDCICEICSGRKTLGNEPISTNYNPLELWALAARWAELELRTINNQ